jgi:regulatory protein
MIGRMPSVVPSPALTEAALHEAALNHLARFAATEAGLRRVLHHRIRRWLLRATRAGLPPEEAETSAAEARLAADAIVARLVRAGVVNDANFAEGRARRLLRSGRSARAALAHLAQKGVEAGAARAALQGAEVPDEAVAALAFCRRRRIGPFAGAEPDLALRLKWLGALARAGFPRDIAEAALRLPRDAAEARLGGA